MHRARKLLGREEQKTVALEERPAGDVAHGMKEIGSPGQSVDNGACGCTGQFRRRTVNHHNDRFNALRESLLVCEFPLAPGKVRRDQIGEVRVDGKMTRRVESGHCSESDANDDEEPGIPGAKVDRPADD